MNEVHESFDKKKFRRASVRGVGEAREDEVAFLLRYINRFGGAPGISESLGRLGNDQKLVIRESAKNDPDRVRLPNELAHRWELFWDREYGVKVDLFGLEIPKPPLSGKFIFCIMVEEMSSSVDLFYRSDQVVYGGKLYRFTDDIDSLGLKHKHTGTFGFWAKDSLDAEDGLLCGNSPYSIHLHTRAVLELNWSTTTVPMRQLLGRMYWRNNGVHLDRNVTTFCPDSLFVGGESVLSVGCNVDGGGVEININSTTKTGHRVRFRRVIL